MLDDSAIRLANYCSMRGERDLNALSIRLAGEFDLTCEQPFRDELARLLDGFAAHVNLIPYNSIGAGLSGAVYAKPHSGRMQRFMEILREHHVVAHFRRTRGDDVSAACGQLQSRLNIADDHQRMASSTGPQMMTKTC